MKKMTAKEFWEVLQEHCKMHKDVWGYEGILNKIIQSYWKDADFARKHGNNLSAHIYEERADRLYNYLNSIGYYDR